MRYMTAGESHGKMLVGIIEGMPSHLTVDIGLIDRDLSRRQAGYGRGGRMKIECDRAQIVSGVRNSVTLGSPIAVLVENLDYPNWAPYMDAVASDTTQRTVTEVRPGHADYAGCVKYGHTDARNILERSSARNTASVVALGSIAKQFLSALGVRVASYVTRIGAAADGSGKRYTADEILARADASQVRCMDAVTEAAMIAEIDRAKAEKDTVGGAFCVQVSGMRVGVGSCMDAPSKLDGRLVGALGGLQGIKSVSVGAGARYAEMLGSAVHDEMFPSAQGVARRTNHAGGLEGGMTNGEEIVLEAVFKPIPTTMKGLRTVDIVTGEAVVSSRERSDVCAVSAAAVVAEAVVALELCAAVLQDFGGGDMKEIIKRWK